MTKFKLNLSMGSVLTAAGLFMRALQICFMSFGVRSAANSMLTLVVTCITVGGFCVMAAELKGRGAMFSLLCAVLMLVGVMSAESLKMLGLVSMILTFVSFVVLLYTVRRGGWQLALAALVSVLAAVVLLQALGVISLPGVLISVVLAAVYISMGAGLIL